MARPIGEPKRKRGRERIELELTVPGSEHDVNAALAVAAAVDVLAVGEGLGANLGSRRAGGRPAVQAHRRQVDAEPWLEESARRLRKWAAGPATAQRRTQGRARRRQRACSIGAANHVTACAVTVSSCGVAGRRGTRDRGGRRASRNANDLIGHSVRRALEAIARSSHRELRLDQPSRRAVANASLEPDPRRERTRCGVPGVRRLRRRRPRCALRRDRLRKPGRPSHRGPLRPERVSRERARSSHPVRRQPLVRASPARVPGPG